MMKNWDRRAWQATAHDVTNSQTWLYNRVYCFKAFYSWIRYFLYTEQMQRIFLHLVNEFCLSSTFLLFSIYISYFSNGQIDLLISEI